MTRISPIRASFLTSFALSFGLAIGCSPATDGNPAGVAGGTEDGDGDDDSDIVIDPSNTGTGTSADPRAANGIPVRQKQCDENGENCTCLRLALLGTLDSAADDTDTSAFTAWLNGNSGGTATVEMITVKPTLNEAFLANYDILLAANVNGWTFSPEEQQAVADWSATGGGIISLTGFVSTAAEVGATSQLISFAELSYAGASNADWTAPQSGETLPIYHDGGTEDLRACMPGRSQERITTPIKFSPQTGTLEPLTFELDYVGAYIGWPVTGLGGQPVPAEATVIATDPVSGQNMAVAHEVGGAGRVLAFGDEWVIFANQWAPSGPPDDQTQADHNPCWIEEEGKFHGVDTLYQTKQFWYNAISWVAPPNECNFVVDDADVVVR